MAALTRLSSLVSLVAMAAASEARAADVDHRCTVNSSVAIDARSAVGDVVAVDGDVRVQGVVRGHVFAVDSRVVLEADSVVLGSVTVYGGALTVRPGATLPSSLYLNGAAYEGPGSAELGPGKRVSIGKSAELSMSSAVASTVSVALMKRLLPFSRFVPAPGMPEVQRYLGGDLALRRLMEDPKDVSIGGVARLSFVTGKVRGAFQRGYRGPRGSVLVTGVHLLDGDKATALWAQLESAVERARPTVSVRSALGDGAHWFFKKRNRYCLIWQKASWVMAVEARLADPDASLFQQVRFTEQVLHDLEQQLKTSSAVPRGVER